MLNSGLVQVAALKCQIFDLLDNVLPITPAGRSGHGSHRSSSQQGFPGAFSSSMNLAAMANGGGGVLKRKALVLKNDPEGNGKYIAGLNDVRVKTRQVRHCTHFVAFVLINRKL
jgi:kinesin family protein 20